MEILHNSQNIIFRNPLGAVHPCDKVEISILANPAKEVILRTWQDNIGETQYQMIKDGEYFRYTLSMPNDTGLLWYYFIVTEENGHVFWYGNNNESLGGIGSGYGCEPPSYQITIYNEAESPSWFKNAIYYQIFPDRFYCDQAKEGLRTWGETPSYDKNPDGSIKHWDFYGGTLTGIKEKLPYLSMLNISAIYLNPIFKAASNHRYDTSDYMEIDPLLGTTKDFEDLCKAARDLGIYIILDGVFSHTGIQSKYFVDHPEWYARDNNGEIKYWWGVKDLPEVNEMEASYLEFICGENGVIKHWLRLGAMGFRLDVADELPDEFIKRVRKALKEENPEAVLIGEVWEDASNKFSHGEKRQYFMGEELDSVMNYPLRSALLDYMLGNSNIEILTKKILSLQENYPKENFDSCLNILGSHDRERLLSVLGYGKCDHENYVAVQKLKSIAALQYALPGVPGIYYGDEAGLLGGADPENRACYPWGKENGDILYTYRMLGHIYKEHPALSNGSFTIHNLDNNLFCFIRDNGDETIVIVNNRDEYHKFYSLDSIGEYHYALDLIKSKEYEPSHIEIQGLSTQYILIKQQKITYTKLERSAGVICALSSIDNPYSFIDYIAEAGFKIWQLLPINPRGLGDCPYLTDSVFAADPCYIDYNKLPAKEGLESFKEENAYWLDSYTRFENRLSGKPIEELELEQYYFDTQWKDIKKYANSKGILLFGDIPIYTSPTGCDIESHPEAFQIDELGRIKARSGVPPDYFQEDGQDWGNPLYNWNEMKKDGYTWWTNRIKQCLERFDYVRLDHFRSFSEYYSIPAGKTAKEGYWQKGPGLHLFINLGELKDRIIAEDLGILDDEVFNLLKLSGIPGMNVWQFSKDEMCTMSKEDAQRRVFYSGTHDNNTLLGWMQEANPNASINDAKEALESLWATDAPWVIIQLQDMLFLGEEARMNVPGVANGCWKWKVKDEELSKDSQSYFKTLSKKYER